MVIKSRALLSAALLAVFLSGPALPAFADLGDFKDNVEKEEQKPKKGADKADDDDGNSGDSQLFLLAVELWAMVNLSVEYDKYPYADGPFIRYKFSEDEYFKRKIYRFSVEGDGYWAPDSGAGFHAEFEGRAVPLIGPRFEVTSLFDGEDQLHLVCLGGALSLFQTNILSADFYLQWASMQGLVDRMGTAYGITLVSYPFKPLSLRAKLGGQTFTTGLVLGDWSVEAGFHFDRYEFLAGYRALQADDFQIAGPYLGLRAHF